MSVWPARALLTALGAWTAATAALVLIPALLPVAAAALAVLLALVAWDARLLRARRPLTVERVVPARSFVGQQTWLEVQLANAGSALLRATVFEELPRDVTQSEPRFDDVQVPPGATTVLRYAVTPSQRGDRSLGRVVAFERSPLGLLQRRVFSPVGAPLRVHPDTSRFLNRTALDPQRLLATLGLRPARRRGGGMEFESLRDYVPGDDPRRLDWAAGARRGRPVVRQYQHERDHVVLIAIDTSRLMAARVGQRTKLDCAIDAALALAVASLSSGDRVGLAVFDRGVRARLTPRSHRAELGAFVEVLRPLAPRFVEVDHGAFVRDIAVTQRQRALIVVLTDFVEAESARLAAPFAVLARRHRVLLVAIRDPIFALLDPAQADAANASDLALLHRRIVLDDLLHERETTLAALRRCGVETLDLAPEAITAPVLNRYLAIRHGPER